MPTSKPQAILTSREQTVLRLARELKTGLLDEHDSCVICQNEGQHELSRPHVWEGQE